MSANHAAILERAVGGDRRSLARAITLVEIRSPQLGQAMRGLAIRRRSGPGHPHVVGITGPPGAGKSTFVDRLVGLARTRGERVAVVAVDPSSPFSGGAILGDRIRMEDHTADDGVYVRSLSNRGNLGGLSIATTEVVDVLDAVGFDTILVETVGVGQSELAVMGVADTSIVVLTPESGDAIQAMKAGLLEIADVFVVNKSDRPGAARLARELERTIAMAEPSGESWTVPVHTACSLDRTGIEDVSSSVQAHRQWCVSAGRDAWWARRGDARVRLYLDLVAERARAEARTALTDADLDALRRFDMSHYELLGDP
jgi:LAO/AO transport system kinase